MTSSPRRLLLRARPLIVGADPGCDVVVDAAEVAPRQACAWAADGAILVSNLDDTGDLLLDGAPVGARSQGRAGALLRLGDGTQFELVAAALLGRPFLVRAFRQPGLGVVIEEADGARRLELAEGRTAELAFCLARRLAADEARGVSAGWVDDADLASRLWGVRGQLTSANENSLNVCVYRLRAQLEMAGLPRDLIQKSQRRTRFAPDRLGAHGTA